MNSESKDVFEPSIQVAGERRIVTPVEPKWSKTKGTDGISYQVSMNLPNQAESIILKGQNKGY